MLSRGRLHASQVTNQLLTRFADGEFQLEYNTPNLGGRALWDKCKKVFFHREQNVTLEIAAGFAGGRMDTVAGLVLMTPSIGFVDLSVINGEVIVKDGKLLTLHLQVIN